MPNEDVFNPFQAPTSAASDIDDSSDEGRIGPPWEHEGSTFQRFSDTVTGVLFRPTETFRTMRREGRWTDARNFMMLGFTVGTFFNNLYPALLFFALAGGNATPEKSGAIVGQLVCGTILAPIGAIIALYLGGGILHGCLYMVGGAKRPMETTFRTVSYMQGSTMMWSLIPIVGAICSLQGIYVGTVGLSEMHGISRGRAFVALFLPALVIFGVLAVVFIAAVGTNAR